MEGIRDHEPRQNGLDGRSKCWFVDLAVRFDERDGALPELLVGHRHHDGASHGVDSLQRRLDVLGQDVLASGNEQVVEASENDQAPLLVQPSQVARGEPPLLVEGALQIRTLDIPREACPPANENLTGSVDPELAVAQYAARRSQLVSGGPGRRRRHLRRHFGQSVSGVNRQAVIDRGIEQVGRHGGAPQKKGFRRAIPSPGRGQKATKLSRHHRSVRRAGHRCGELFAGRRQRYRSAGKQTPIYDRQSAHVIER